MCQVCRTSGETRHFGCYVLLLKGMCRFCHRPNRVLVSYLVYPVVGPGVEMANLWWQSESFGTQAISSWFRLILSLPWLEKAFLA